MWIKNNYKTTVTNCGFKDTSFKTIVIVTMVLQLFLIRPHFNGVIILILFLKYFFIKTTIKPQLVTVVLLMVL